MPESEGILNILEDVVNQACLVWVDKDNNPCGFSSIRRDAGEIHSHLNSMALSVNADAMRLLAKHGRLVITKEYGRCVIGKWPKKESPDG